MNTFDRIHKIALDHVNSYYLVNPVNPVNVLLCRDHRARTFVGKHLRQ